MTSQLKCQRFSSGKALSGLKRCLLDCFGFKSQRIALLCYYTIKVIRSDKIEEMCNRFSYPLNVLRCA